MSFAERGRGTHDRSRGICSAAGIQNAKTGKVSMPFRDFPHIYIKTSISKTEK